MTLAVKSILRQATRKPNERLNILSFSTHERYQSNLADTNCEFYLWHGTGVKKWDKRFGPVPSNHHLLPHFDGNQQSAEILKTVPMYVDYDAVLSQSKAGQYPIAYSLSKLLNVPLISIEHTLPTKEWQSNTQAMQQLKLMKGDINLFISEYSKKQWGWTDEDKAEVIYHGIDTDIFKLTGVERQPYILSVVNDWINRDWCCGFKLWQESTKGLKVRCVGDTPGLSSPASSILELIHEYNRAQVFINTSLISPIPTALLEAAACGCGIISTNNCAIGELITHGENGFLANTPQEIHYFASELLKNPALCYEFGRNARKTVLEKFNKETFVKKWDEIFRRASNIVYKD